MRTTILIILTLFSSLINAQEINAKIITVQNIYFMHFSGKEYKEIFRTPDDSHLYGYGLLSNNKALFAYQNPKTAEAVAVIEVIDTNSKKVIFKKEIGGTGESSFDFSKETGKAVFNESDRLNTIELINDKIIISPVVIFKDENPYAPFWVSTNTIGYFVFEGEQVKFKTIKAP